MLTSQPYRWLLTLAFLTTVVAMHAFVPALGDGRAAVKSFPKMPAPTCAAPQKLPKPPPYDSAPPIPAKSAEQPNSKESVAIINLPMPEAIAGSQEIPREEFPAPAFEADDDEVVVETTPAVPMPLIPMPAPAPAADLPPIIQPAVVVDSAPESVQQVNFQKPDFVVAKCFRGHCPVGIEKHELIQANQEIHTDHQGIRYFFASEAAQEEFKLNPEKFAPVLGGDCIVRFARTGDRITGNFVANHVGQQYWFVDEQARTDFKTDPAACLARVEWHKKFLDRYSR